MLICQIFSEKSFFEVRNAEKLLLQMVFLDFVMKKQKRKKKEKEIQQDSKVVSEVKGEEVKHTRE